MTWTITLDAFGNLNPVAPAVFTPGNPACATNPGLWPITQTVYNYLGYGATMDWVDPYGTGYHKDVATLIIP